MIPLARTAARLLIALAAMFPPAVAHAETPHALRLSYEVWTGGLNSLGLEAYLRRTETAYRVDLDARTQGLVGSLFPYELSLEAAGHIGPDGLTPQRFRTIYGEDGQEKRRDIRYHRNGALELSVDGQRKRIARRGLSEDLVRGSMDPASAIFSVMEVFARTQRCRGAFPVFDGKRRYDLMLTERGHRMLSHSRYGLYSGPTTLCRLRVEKRAGFRKRERGRFPSTIDVWLAPVGKDTPALPVRIESRSNLGALVIHLTGVKRLGAANQAQR